jgi:hypothetical protein
VVVTLSDDDEIYSVTIPAGTMRRSASGNTFTLRDRSGSNNALVQARFKVGKRNKPSTLEIRTTETDLSNADLTDHTVTIVASFGPHTASGTSDFVVKGRLGRILRVP